MTFFDLSHFLNVPDNPGDTKYLYEGVCPTTGKLLQLPRTSRVEAIALSLLEQLRAEKPSPREGKMFGVLLVRDSDGRLGVLKAFSGLLNGEGDVEGWVPMTPGKNEVAWEETRTLALLEKMKQELIRLWEIPERELLATKEREFEQQRSELRRRQKENKAQRKQKRLEYQQALQGQALREALKALSEQSQNDKRERQRLNAEFDRDVGELRDFVEQTNREMRALKQERKQVSRALQEYMHSVYSLTNFAGVVMSLREILPTAGIPTGTGECCAPKLLHYAATQRMCPLAMAEFWYGPAAPDGARNEGVFYGACQERCQPIMGFLLSGMTEVSLPAQVEPTLHVLYEDQHLLVVDKPFGLLSVPGRYLDRQDSVVSRARNLYPEISGPVAVHRLDQETSGLLLLAKNADVHKQLSRQFQERTVQKEYEALLCGVLGHLSGEVALPLASVGDDTPRHTVDYENGKPSQTLYQVVEQTDTTTRIRLTPVTGRTHQLRVHASHPDGLHLPILGDPLYGREGDKTGRLCLHARKLTFCHPVTGEELSMVSEVPF